MRNLTKKQKDLIIKAFNNNNELYSVDSSIMNDLEKINDYETLYQDANRFIMDLRMEYVYRR